MGQEESAPHGALGRLFAEAAAWLAEGRRGAELGAAFRGAFDARAEVLLAELADLVRSALRHAGLAAWPGARLGVDFMDLARLDDPEAAERLALQLVAADELGLDGAAASGLGWIGGPLFRGGRLLGYLKAAEEDPEKALAYLRRNLARELQRKRAAADPVGAALFDNLNVAAEEASTTRGNSETVRDAVQRFDAPTTRPRFAATPLLTKAGLTVRIEPHNAPPPGAVREDAEVLHAELMRVRAVLAALVEAAERNAAREEGTRNLVMRGPTFVAPLRDHFLAWGASDPTLPACAAVHVGALANELRGDLPAQAELLEVAMPTDDEGRELAIAVAPTWIDAGSAAVDALMDAWRAALDQAPKLSSARRTKLHRILDALGERFADGQFQELDLAALRSELAIKPQTFSDDWKLLRALCPLAAWKNTVALR